LLAGAIGSGQSLVRRTLHLWALAAVMLSGALFGAMGIALATPLVAVMRVAVVRLYVEDQLGDK